MTNEKLIDTWDLCIEVSRAIFGLTRTAVDPIVKENGLEKRGYLFTLLNARRFHPEGVSAERLHRLFPYGHPQAQENFLIAGKESGWLQEVKTGEYHLADRAQRILDQIQDSFYARLAELPAPQGTDRPELARLFHELVDQSLAASQPEEKPRLALSRKLHPPESTGALAQIDQHLDDLNAFRDDSHIAAWHPLNISGIAWESFTLVWRDAYHDDAGLAERLHYRGHDEAAYGAALEQLAARGWLELLEGRYEMTAAGRDVRRAAEDRTNRYFFTPWEQLGTTRIQRFQHLLQQLHHSLSLELAAQAV